MEFSALAEGGYKDYRETVQPAGLIPQFIFRGFQKACHFEYKFDSKTEQDTAFILENDATVLKWLRPAPNQFRMYWDRNSARKYEPDFIAETSDTIYMLETKMSRQMQDEEVRLKKKAAEKYCSLATAYTQENSGKRWQYIIIPHNAVNRTNSFAFLIQQFADQ